MQIRSQFAETLEFLFLAESGFQENLFRETGKLELKNFVSDPFGLDSLNHCSGFGVRCSSDSSVLPIKIDSGGQDEGNDSHPACCAKYAMFLFHGFCIRRNCYGRN